MRNRVVFRRIIMLKRFLAAWKERATPAAAGERGEASAERYLVTRHGYRLVARNWRNPRDRREEIDLVMTDGEVLVFIEVKARAAGALVPGYYAVNARKKKILRRACQAYLRRLRPPPRTFRFDIAEVALTATGDALVRHFENVPLFPKGFRF
jgi:putative endonuclease